MRRAMVDHEVHGQPHRTPAPRLRAINARNATAEVKRARFAFTISPRSVATLLDRRPGGLRSRDLEIPGFASPPHSGFALDSPSSDGRLPMTGPYRDLSPGPMSRWYYSRRAFGGV